MIKVNEGKIPILKAIKLAYLCTTARIRSGYQMNKKSIFLASTQKPINDSRMFEKFALSLSQHFRLSVFGWNAPVPNVPEIEFICLHTTQRLQWYKEFWKSLHTQKPDYIIVHHPELLPVSLAYKIKHPSVCLFYDMQENYFRNFHYQNLYPKGIKTILGIGFRTLEYLSLPFLQKIFCAEKCYPNEIPFIKKKALVLENKYKSLYPSEKDKIKEPLKPKVLKLLLCGTISKVFGAERAIEFVERLNQESTLVQLKIIGKGVEEDLISEIKEKAEKLDYITIEGIDQLVAHQQIINEMKKADAILLPYLPNKSTENCIPTKLYEAMALGIPMLIQKNKLWETIIKKHQAGLMIDFHSTNTQIVNTFLEQSFYPNGIVKEAYWENEEKKLLKVMREIR
ncbi:glycosyltransferase [Sediminitomix flava]|uniref:Glycosyltransferase involved in cell wall biosynthesis n=1 Tax=Sediminitomix flava TaxID=379075 RepID=A0A315ZHW3_SEDFL|nr:glycosyltransferase [Sediminitomix flava]PWJ44408.1 glycosyltransferase involved in cell wall biosynthesis [Sediminitomix flava]